MAETVDARKRRLDAGRAGEVLEGILDLHVAKGRAVRHVDLRNAASRDEAGGLVLGPTGNLRAPTARIGSTLLVGFDEATWSAALEG